MRFTIEIVGIAHQFLLKRKRQHVARFERQMLLNNLLCRESGSGVAFTHQAMLFKPKRIKYFSALYPVPQIRQFAIAEY